MYWIASKIIGGKIMYVSGTDEYGYPAHSANIDEAWKHRAFSSVYALIMMGYHVTKFYE